MEILGSQGRLWGIAVAGLHLSEEPHGLGAVPKYSAHMGGRLRWSEAAGFRQSRGVSFTHFRAAILSPNRHIGPLLLPEVYPLSAIADTGLFCEDQAGCIATKRNLHAPLLTARAMLP